MHCISQGGYASVLSVSTVTTEKGKSLSFFPIFMTLVVSLFLQPWVLRCCSAFPSTDAVKSAARADSALQLQVSGNYTLIVQKTTKTAISQWCDHRMPDSLSLPIPRPSVPIEEMKPRLCSTTSWSSDSDGAGSLSRNSQIYFSTKARLSFRHQLDSNINAVDSTN